MDVQELMSRASDSIGTGRSFGPAYEKDGLLIIPVAWVAGGGGGGSGEAPRAKGASETATPDGDAKSKGERQIGSGGGFGAVSWPLGVYVVKEGQVRWVPAIDATRLLLAGVAL